MSDRDADFAAGLLPPMSPEGWRVIPWFVVATLVLFWIWTPLGWIGVAFTLWCATLFREPARTLPAHPFVAVSPIDGTVAAIVARAPPAELNLGADERICVTVALGPWDSHIARAPVNGAVIRRAHGYGGREGERLSFAIDGSAGAIGTVLMASGLGRRVRSGAGEGHTLSAGDRLATILFAGSVQICLPPGAVAEVTVGQRMVAGETIIA